MQLEAGSPIFLPLPYTYLYLMRIFRGSLTLGAFVSTIQNSVFEECMETNCSPESLPIYSLIGGFLRLKILQKNLCSSICWLFELKEGVTLYSFNFSKVYMLVQLRAFRNYALSFFQLVLRSQKFNSKMAHTFPFPLYQIRFIGSVPSEGALPSAAAN